MRSRFPMRSVDTLMYMLNSMPMAMPVAMDTIKKRNKQIKQSIYFSAWT